MANQQPGLLLDENSESNSMERHTSGVAESDRRKTIPLICLPFAGVGASFFSEWSGLTRSPLEIVSVQLPGREKRFTEEPYRDVATAVTGILPDVLERVSDRDHVIIFGHSLGAVLAYELSHRLAETTKIQVDHLVVSGSPGPWAPRKRRATGLDDNAFLDQIRDFAGYDHPALNDPDLREMLLPVLRADVEMHENYCPSWDGPIPVAITSVRGSDDELVAKEEANQWRTATTMQFQLKELPGGHMYLTMSAGRLLRLIETLIAQPMSVSCR
jgi:surfactin synthase thioesterase subunit